MEDLMCVGLAAALLWCWWCFTAAAHQVSREHTQIFAPIRPLTQLSPPTQLSLVSSWPGMVCSLGWPPLGDVTRHRRKPRKCFEVRLHSANCSRDPLSLHHFENASRWSIRTVVHSFHFIQTRMYRVSHVTRCSPSLSSRSRLS